MIAIIEIGGKQYTVSQDSTLVVDRQHLAEGENLEVAPLLVASEDGKTVKVGGEKVRVFKMKAKKRYVRSRGFRPSETTLTVTAIA